MAIFEKQATEFLQRHLGPSGNEVDAMVQTIGVQSVNELIDKTVPETIRLKKQLALPAAMSEYQYLQHIKNLSLKNKIFKNYIGQGYYDTITPSVILRNIFENPGWYTQYTPYQAEISQGRLESLLNYQTLVCDLTALPITNASLLDEATAAAEAMAMFFGHVGKSVVVKNKFFVDEKTFPQTIDVLLTRAKPLGIEIITGSFKETEIDESYFGALVQYPNADGEVCNYQQFAQKIHDVGAYIVFATDLLALTLLTPPGELGADAAIGNSQRFGVPLGCGGPHAAFFATKDEFKRVIPGRIIGVSIDANNERALRMALQTREQHIKREKATSNICTAQALLANMAAMYAVYHGAEGLKEIATRTHVIAMKLEKELNELGVKQLNEWYFDTLKLSVENVAAVKSEAEENKLNFYYAPDGTIQISVDETTSLDDVRLIKKIFQAATGSNNLSNEQIQLPVQKIPQDLTRTSAFLLHPVFNLYRSESQMMRYIKRLENKDLSLNTSMISLGSCTMKLNAATEMMPLSWTHWSKIHPLAPENQMEGYNELTKKLEEYLCAVTAFDACSLQPNSGAQGEYAGLLTIKGYHESRGEHNRNVMLIPISAHGTNPASAVMAGMKVVVVKALENGYIDVEDLKTKAAENSANLAGIMITYPSTYGVFEETVITITDIIHQHGGQVYMDGANMNAQSGLTAPGLIGADVCHLNLHKTFAIPHGGGGPGMGPICVKKHLQPFLPGHVALTNKKAAGAVSAAPYGSASILLISYAYIGLLGADGVRKATETAILNANYMKARLDKEYDILYLGTNGTCGHEFIVDLRPFKKSAEVEAEDVAKRLMDYGFHAPTLSFPVPGTIMIEPTESEDKAELDRFCDALLQIREEIRAVESGQADKKNNLLKGAPHTQRTVISSNWDKPYSREEAAFPLPFVVDNKFWPSIARVNNTYGDRNLICTCEPIESYM